jgi:hypothetical protein
MRFFLVTRRVSAVALVALLFLVAPVHADEPATFRATTAITNLTSSCAFVTIYDQQSSGWSLVSDVWVQSRSRREVQYRKAEPDGKRSLRYRAEFFEQCYTAHVNKPKYDLAIEKTSPSRVTTFLMVVKNGSIELEIQ